MIGHRRYTRLEFDLNLRFMLDGELQQRVGSAQSELLADVGPVIVNRARVYEQLLGDLFARFVFGNHFEHTPLGRRQLFQVGPGACFY